MYMTCTESAIPITILYQWDLTMDKFRLEMNWKLIKDTIPQRITPLGSMEKEECSEMMLFHPVFLEFQSLTISTKKLWGNIFISRMKFKLGKPAPLQLGGAILQAMRHQNGSILTWKIGTEFSFTLEIQMAQYQLMVVKCGWINLVGIFLWRWDHIYWTDR